MTGRLLFFILFGLPIINNLIKRLIPFNSSAALNIGATRLIFATISKLFEYAAAGGFTKQYRTG